jgi:hypothetical protein
VRGGVRPRPGSRVVGGGGVPPAKHPRAHRSNRHLGSFRDASQGDGAHRDGPPAAGVDADGLHPHGLHPDTPDPNRAHGLGSQAATGRGGDRFHAIASGRDATARGRPSVTPDGLGLPGAVRGFDHAHVLLLAESGRIAAVDLSRSVRLDQLLGFAGLFRLDQLPRLVESYGVRRRSRVGTSGGASTRRKPRDRRGPEPPALAAEPAPSRVSPPRLPVVAANSPAPRARPPNRVRPSTWLRPARSRAHPRG